MVEPKPLARQLRPLIYGLCVVVVLMLSMTWGCLQLQIYAAGLLNGESIWSKAQKQAVIDIQRYAITQSSGDLDAFRRSIAVLSDFRWARDQVTSGEYDYDAVAIIFLKQGVLARAIPSCLFAMSHLSWVPPIRTAMSAWRSVDAPLDELVVVANELHAQLQDPVTSKNDRAVLLNRIYALTTQIEPATNLFSTATADGVVSMTNALTWGMVSVSLLAILGWLAMASRMLSRLRQTEDRYKVLFEGAADAIVIFDNLDDTVADANAIAIEWFGRNIIGERFSTLFASGAYNLHEPVNAATLRTATGVTRHVEMQGSVIKLDSQHLHQVILRDMSNRVALERERRVAAVFGHELRNPLNAIINAARLIDGPTGSLTQMMVANAHLLLHRINDTIDMVAVNEGNLPFRSAPFLLTRLAEMLRDEWGPQSSIKSQKLNLVTAHSSDLMLLGDVGRIAQVVGNIIGNAIKYSPDGATVEVTIAASSADQAWNVVFTVEDQGPGIPDDHKPNVFEPFYRAASCATATYQGLGIGLFLVKKISDALRGSVNIRDNPRGGTIVTWSLTLSEAPRLADDVATTDPNTLLEVHKNFVPALRCLVADDNASNRLILKHVLLKAGHVVTEVSDGIEALKALSGERFDMALLDMHMPSMSGAEVVTAALANRTTYLLPRRFVIVSADTNTNRMGLRGLPRDVSYLPKPFSLEGLLDLLVAVSVEDIPADSGALSSPVAHLSSGGSARVEA